MASNAAVFAMELDREFKAKVEDRLVEVVQKLGLDLLRRIVLKTPVDTGRARGNWFVTIGSPSGAVSQGTDPGGQASIARGSAVITGLTKPQAIWISNNLPYIVRLENGHSRQAPAGMVAVSLAEMSAFLTRIE